MRLTRRELLLTPVALSAASGVETYVYKRAGACEIKADVIGGAPGLKAPVLLYIHGGALISGSRTSLAASRPEQTALLRQAGFVIVSIDYRLAPETKIPGILEDVRDAWDWTRRECPRFGGDPERIVVMGGSAGGYLTLVCGYLLRPRPRALVSFYGYGDILGDWYAKPDPFYLRQPAVSRQEAWAAVGREPVAEPPPGSNRGRFYLWCRQQGRWLHEVGGLDPAKDRARFVEWCPRFKAGRGYPPAILLHGDKDTDVPYEQSTDMAAVLARLGVEHEMVSMPGLGHGFDRDMKNPDVSAAVARAVGFAARHVR